MATKAKESSLVGKEKKAPSSNSPITSTTKRTPKPSTATTTPTEKATSNPSEKQIPNYLKPTISSRLESHSHSFKLPKSDGSNNKPIINRRRSFDKPISPSGEQLKKQPSPSRQHKALVSPGPRERSLSLKSSIGPVKSIISPSNKPISERASKTNKEGKTQPIVAAKIAKKSSPGVSTSTTKKVANDNASANNSTNTAKSVVAVAETTEKLNVESEPEVKEAINEEVVKVENQENGVENVPEIPPHVEPEHKHDEHEHEHDHKPEEPDQPQIQAVDEKVIPTVPEEEEAAAKEEPQEEKIEDEKKNEEGENNTDQDESKNNNESAHPEELNHSTTEEEVVEVKEKEEKEEEGGVKVIAEEDHRSEINNNNGEEAVEEIKEGVEGGKSEAQEEHEHVENGVKEAKEENKAESTNPKQQEVVMLHGKKEAQVSNGVIEETASKLLEERKNKVKALAGAFQSVIDYQAK